MAWILALLMYRPSSLFLVSVVLVGCGGAEPPPPDEVRARIANDLVAVLDGAEAATADGASLPDTSSFALVENALGRPFDTMLSDDGDLALQIRPALSKLSAALTPARTTGTRLPNDETEEGPAGAEAAQWLNENIFTDANHTGDGIYTVPAALVCTETQYDDQGNPIGEAVDPECAQSFAKLEVRVRVSEDDDLLKLALQLGPNHDEPLALGLSPTHLSLTVDLHETEDAVKALAPKFGEAAPNAALAGAVTAKLELTGPAAAAFSLSIDRDVSIKVAEGAESLDGPNAFRFTSERATVFSVALDGTAKTMQSAVDLGPTTAHIPDETGAFELDLPGASATATFQAGQPLEINGISLGDRTTTVKIGGQTAITLDLNPNDGRSLDAKIDGDLLTVAPRLDFRSHVDHAVLGDAAPVYDVTRIFLDGALRGRTDGSVEVATGTFAIETNPTSYGFSATAGQCVSSSSALDVNGEYYEQFTVGACN